MLLSHSEVCSDFADSVVKATCKLSNSLHSAEESQHPDSGQIGEADGMENIVAPIRNLRRNMASAEALRVRHTFYQ